MQAIETKFIGPTNTKGARIKAILACKSIVIPYPYEYEETEAHHYAALSLINTLQWNVSIITGKLRNGNYVHVLT